MGVYIKGMEMPKCCAECDAEGHYENYNGDEYGFFCPFGYKAYTEKTRDAKRLDNCPLVPVTEHGRLIDADEFLKRAIGTKCFHGDYALMLEELVGESATIIPAEPAEEGEI